MLLYIIPIIVFVIVSYGLYHFSKDSKKDNNEVIFIRNILPGLFASIFAFICIKYKDTLLSDETVMQGNYYDTNKVNIRSD